MLRLFLFVMRCNRSVCPCKTFSALGSTPHLHSAKRLCGNLTHEKQRRRSVTFPGKQHADGEGRFVIIACGIMESEGDVSFGKSFPASLFLRSIPATHESARAQCRKAAAIFSRPPQCVDAAGTQNHAVLSNPDELPVSKALCPFR